MELRVQEAMLVPDMDTGFLGAIPQEILLGLISFLGGPGKFRCCTVFFCSFRFHESSEKPPSFR